MVKAILQGQKPAASEVKFADGETFQEKYDSGELTGPAGAPGKDGAAGAPGKDGAAGSKGDPGDIWVPSVDSDTGALSWSKNSGINPPTVIIKGPKGDSGPKGDTGSQGIQGPAGPNQVTNTTSTNLNGLIKGNGSNILSATADTDYLTPAGASSKYMPVTGGTFTGDISVQTLAGKATLTGNSLGFSKAGKITGLNNPTQDNEAANKAYVDSKAGGSTLTYNRVSIQGNTPTEVRFIEDGTRFALTLNPSYSTRVSGIYDTEKDGYIAETVLIRSSYSNNKLTFKSNLSYLQVFYCMLNYSSSSTFPYPLNLNYASTGTSKEFVINLSGNQNFVKIFGMYY